MTVVVSGSNPQKTRDEMIDQIIHCGIYIAMHARDFVYAENSDALVEEGSLSLTVDVNLHEAIPTVTVCRSQFVIPEHWQSG